MSETPTIKLPVWAITVIIALLGGIVSSVMYVVETRAEAMRCTERLEDVDGRLKNIQDGVHQIWERLLDMEEGKK